ncbi:hypothetical protein KKD57_03205 [Patescibacteria group bacterium]|nr:hypothetical protein [Patescibacteria group bacterium]
MDKKLTYALIIGILTISFSIAYYFFAFLPTNEKNRAVQEAKEKQEIIAQQDLENNIKCKEAGDKLYNAKVIEEEEFNFYYDPEFRFNKNLNTCLYKGKSTEALGFSESFIQDVYSNEIIYVWRRNESKIDIIGNEQDFNKKYTELFKN